jgi:hypothetical protein
MGGHYKGYRFSNKITWQIVRKSNGGYARLGWFVRPPAGSGKPANKEPVSTMKTGPGASGNWAACASYVYPGHAT